MTPATEPNMALAPLLYCAALLFSGTTIVAQAAAPPSPTTNLMTNSSWLIAAVALVGAIGAQIDSYRKRSIQKEIVKSKLELESVKSRQNLTDKAVRLNRNKLIKVEESIKGMELLRNIGFTGGGGKKPSILLVDDDPTTLNQLGQFLVKNLGDFNLLQALTIEDALKKVEVGPSWIFLDIKVGDRSGLEVVAPAKSYNPDCKIIAVTGWNDPEQLDGSVLLGVDIWKKPLSREELNRMILMLRKDFGGPAPSSVAIPVMGASGIHKGIDGDGSSS